LSAKVKQQACLQSESPIDTNSWRNLG
jgi:hypothetical protein